jgi:formate/nitrite transporter FocA (FNT family)
VGNFIGGLALAAACVYGGQLNYSSGALAVYTIKVAVAKSSLSFGPAILLGILCNLLVCLGVLCALSAKDTAGKILGAYIPVAFFVICGFEHCVANMYYIPAGLLAMLNPTYAQKALDAGIDTSVLSWGRYFRVNLLPVTIGNILGGAGLGILLFVCFHSKKKLKKA